MIGCLQHERAEEIGGLTSGKGRERNSGLYLGKKITHLDW